MALPEISYCTRSQTEGHGVTVISFPRPLVYATAVQVTDAAPLRRVVSDLIKQNAPAARVPAGSGRDEA